LQEALKNVPVVGVLDKNISFGYEGTVYTNVNSSLIHLKNSPRTLNFVGGLGGRDITKDNILQAYELMLKGDFEDQIQYMNVRCEQS
jgi:pyruvate ferredoxin oxidoreductase alpha subunit